MQLVCPDCMSKFSMREALDGADWRELMHTIEKLPPSLRTPTWRYLLLFSPAKKALKASRATAILKELVPLIEASKVVRNRVEYVVQPEQFSRTMLYVVKKAREDGNLELPLKTNGYLLQTLAGYEESKKAKAEIREDERKRNRPRIGKVESENKSVPMPSSLDWK